MTEQRFSHPDGLATADVVGGLEAARGAHHNRGAMPKVPQLGAFGEQRAARDPVRACVFHVESDIDEREVDTGNQNGPNGDKRDRFR